MTTTTAHIRQNGSASSKSIVTESLSENGPEYTLLWEFASWLASSAAKDPRPSMRQFNFESSASRPAKNLRTTVRQFSGLRKDGTLDGLVGVGVGLGPKLKLLVTDERARKKIFGNFQGGIRLRPDFPVEIEVEIVGEPKGQVTTYRRPARLGCSVGHSSKSGGGSIGCLVTRNGQANDHYFLSARHALAPKGAALDTPVHQPAVGYAGSAPIAKLVAVSSFAGKPKADAAIAGPITSDSCVSQFLADNSTPGRWRVPKIGEPVRLYGSGSAGPINGVFDTFLAYHDVELDGFSVVRFFDFGRARLHTAPGDSGGLLVGADGRALGLHCAGLYGYSYFSLMGHVTDALDLTMV